MSIPGFYNDNTGRAYPLIPFSGVLLGQPAPAIPPLDALVDFGCMVGLDAEFDNNKHVVYLYQVIRQTTPTDVMFTFDFRSDAPGLAGYALLFDRALTDLEYTTGYVTATLAGALLDASEPSQAPLWEGFLVTGSLESLAALMPVDGAVLVDNQPRVEPALVQNLEESYLRTINLANQDRIRVTPPYGCEGSEIPIEDPEYIVYVRGLVGDLRFKEGQNIAIRQSDRNNTLTFLASQGAGIDDNTSCAEIPVYPDEQRPADSSLYTGGPACNEVVSSINGLSSSVIQLVADLGTSIYPSQLYANTLVVNIDRHNTTICDPIEFIVEPPPDGGNGGGDGGDEDVGTGKPPPTSSSDCGSLPYSTNFATGFPPAWYVALGNFAIEDNDASGETGRSLASTNLDQRNIAVWNCYRTGNTEMTATVRFKMMPGTQTSGGLVWQYYAKVPDLGLKVKTCVGQEGYNIWLVNAATNSLEQWSYCAGGPDAGLQLVVRWPAGAGVNKIIVGDWYQISARIGKYKTYYPKENPWKFKGVLSGVTKPTFTPVNFGFNYADVPTILPVDFFYTSGVWGVGSFNAHCRFSLFKVENTPMA